MWQVAVAAAVAGSGLLAKHFFPPDPNTSHQQQINTSISPLSSPNSSINNKTTHFTTVDSDHSRATTTDQQDGAIFRFSSSESSKKSPALCKNKTFSRVVRRNKLLGRFDNASTDRRKGVCGGGKRVSVCLKRRKFGRVSSGKFDSSCSKECSSFGWGLGLGIMCMMSAGKAEVSKLSSAIDETTKVVHELKTKISSQCPQLLESSNVATNTMDQKQKLKNRQATVDQCTLNKQPIKTKDINCLADSEYASSVLTEEQQIEGVEMDQLESELESELQKLPWCMMESSHEGNINNSLQIERHESMKPSSTAYQSGGVSPAELKNKLSHLLIEQQESHIIELESELNLAYSKLQEKEAELRALKDCVRCLTEFSLSTVSDEEPEATREQNQSNTRQELENVNMESSTACIGMKRAMDFEMRAY